MSGIIAVGRRGGPFLDAPTPVVAVPATIERADLPQLHRTVAGQIDAAGGALVLYPAVGAEPTLRRIQTVRAALGSPPLMVHELTAPPLAAEVVVTLAAGLAGRLGDLALVAAALPILERQLVTLTWLPRVTGLSDPSPTLWQHTRSLLPGASWLVTSWPEPAVLPVAEDGLPPLPQPSQEVGIAVADHDGRAAWLVEAIQAQLPSSAVVAVDGMPDAPTWWGSRRLTEAVIYPRALGPLVDALLDWLDPGTCAWCRRRVGSSLCPWCGLPRSGVTRQGAPDDLPAIGELLSPAPEPAVRTGQEVGA